MQQDTPVGTATASALPVLARLKLTAELAGLIKEQGAAPAGPFGAMKKARLASQILVVLGKLGVDLNAKKREESAFELEGGPEQVEPRQVTSHIYEFDPNRTTGQRRRDNAAAMELLDAISRGEVDGSRLSVEQKAALVRYSGTGGNLVGADGKKGSAYEYYTPKPVAEAMWGLLGELGFKGGKTLDPCSGVGIFGACAPANVAMESIELNETSGRINQLVNGGPGYNAIISPFEAIASRTADEQYDAVITNVPFGGVNDRGANRHLDERYKDEPLETYFILRSLEKLKPGGLAAFIVPPRVVSARGGREEKLRIAMSYMAEFLGAYRLPNSVFGTADADTITDVIVLRKYGRQALDKIAELKEQNPLALVECKVQWTEYVSGAYFAGEGKRFVLGEFVAKDPTKFRDVDRVVNTGSVADIAKLMRKFPGSRVDWAALNATETEPIAYNEGDTITMAGQTLQMQDGVWVALKSEREPSRFDEVGTLMGTATVACTNQVKWAQASEYVAHLRAQSMELDIPDWLRMAHKDVEAMPEADRPAYWGAILAGLAAVEVTAHHAKDQGFDYSEAYPVISEALKDNEPTARKGRAGLSPASRAALVKACVMYDRRTGYSPLWTGDVTEGVLKDQDLDDESKVRRLKYRLQGVNISVETLREEFGANFDPLQDDEWCLSGDGKTAAKADDYYSGNLGEFLARLDGEIAQADEPLKSKLLRQKALARERVDVVDPQSLRFNLFSPFCSMEEKAEFLRRFVHPAFVVAHDDEGEKYILCDIKSPKNERERQLKRFGEYLKKGNLSTRTSAEEARKNPKLEEERRKMLRDLAATSNAQFDQWVKSNPMIMERMRQASNDPARIYFRQVDDNSPLAIEGMREIDPVTGKPLKLHGYQNAEVRKRARHFSGINGFDVGLGKTFTALACTQYVQAIGVKKKTIFVVPNAVLSNWRREAGRALASMDDCLFIGLSINEKTGQAKVDSSQYPADFNKILLNKHRKIFCTLEAFKTIPLKDETVATYEAFLGRVDPSYAGSDRKADSERADSKLSEATKGAGQKSAAIPFFEDMGIDSIVIDEGHMMKNSKNTVDFSGAKFLSVADASQRGLDVQMKAWFVRNQSALHDGVLILTATPITNSPLEIYSMLSLAVGEEKVHDLTMGAQGADAFMEVMCDIQDDEEESIDGLTRNYRVFRGLQNVNLLRSAMSAVATIKTAKDVKELGDDLKLPEAPENNTRVVLSKEAAATLSEYKMAYRGARELMKGPKGNPQDADVEAMERVMAKFGEPMELIAHPFNLIQKMTAVIADDELDERATFYVISKADIGKAEQVIAQFNKLAKVEVRRMEGPWTPEGAVVGTKTVKDGEAEVVMKRIKVMAALTEDDRIVIDTLDTNLQADFERLAEKAGLDLDVRISPKLAAMVENVRKEEAQPRSKTGRVKQIIFCDILPLHNKIKRLLTKRAGIAAAAIALVSGQSIKNPEQMQGIQDGFNAEGEDNKYRTIVANEKAEVGINLQKGTQAIHHLTIGWTPDSVQQRNGRGVRQGNDTDYVNIYNYDADGTFDSYKRTLTGKKADWIGAVMDSQGGNDVAVAGGLTNDQYDELIEAMGDASAVERAQQKATMREKAAREGAARSRQVINLRTASAQREFVRQYPEAKAWIAEKAMKLYDLRKHLRVMELGLDDPKRSASAMIKLQTRVAEARARVESLTREIRESAHFEMNQHRTGYSTPTTVQYDILEVLDQKTHYSVAAKVRESIELAVKGRMKVIEGSPLEQEWQAEVASAEAMQAEALKDFERIAGGPDSAYPAEVVKAFKAGKVSVIDGQVFCAGMFVRLGGGQLGILTSGTSIAAYPHSDVMTVVDALAKGLTFEMFGTEGHGDCMREAARLDDAVEVTTPEQAELLYSSILPEVGQYRTKATAVTYRADEVKLPNGFVYPVPPAEGASPALKALAASQTDILRWDGGSIVVDVKTAVQVVPSTVAQTGVSGKDRLSALADWAKAKGTPFSVSDYAMVYGCSTQVRSYNSVSARHALTEQGKWPGDYAAVFNACNSDEEIKAAVDRVMAEATGAFLVRDEYTPWTDLAPYAMATAANSRSATLKRQREAAALAEQRAAEAATTGEPAKANMRLVFWVKRGGGAERVYFNDLPGMAAREGIYAYKAHGTEDRDWAFGISGEMTYSRREAFEATILTELVVMNGGASLPSFDRLKEMAGLVQLPADPSVPDVDGDVGIAGDTRRHMAVIKMAAAAVNGSAQWMGRNGGKLQWNVPAKAWQWIQTNRPEVAKDLHTVPA